METAELTANEPTVANADLWAKYFQDQWSAWLPANSPSGVAEGTGARVASFLTLVAAGPIAWLYSANTTNVRQIREESPMAIGAAIASDEMESVEDNAA